MHIVLIFLIMSSFIYADQPTRVWRVDNRPPSAIFTDGFLSWGSNLDLIRHIDGETCTHAREPDSAFISTTSQFAFAENVVRRRLEENSTREFYVYEIRADSNFYDAVLSLDYYTEAHPERPVPPTLYPAAMNAHEYISPYVIPRQNIVNVRSYRMIGNEVVVETEDNYNYLDRETAASSDPFRQNLATAVLRARAFVASGPLRGACFSRYASYDRSLSVTDENSQSEDSTHIYQGQEKYMPYLLYRDLLRSIRYQ